MSHGSAHARTRPTESHAIRLAPMSAIRQSAASDFEAIESATEAAPAAATG
jgi:hypothetical protein